jgi:hypothetical protein
MSVALNPRTVARALGGNVVGRDAILCPGPGHSARDRSLSLRLDPRARDGFLVHSFAGDDWTTCREHVRARLGLSQSLHAPQRTASIRRRDESDQRAVALWLWRQRQPIAGTSAERYLREARHYRGDVPPTLAYLPARGEYAHAMIAAFALPTEPEPGRLRLADAAVRGVHLTRLTPDGSDRDRGLHGKIMIGRGSVGTPIVISPVTDLLGLVIAEGIENALALHAATGLGGWAAGCASRLPALADAVPAYIESVTIGVDPDAAGRRDAAELAQRLAARGMEVRWMEVTP